MSTTLSLADHARLIADLHPALRALQGEAIVVKYGGNAMTDTALKAGFADDIALLRRLGLRVLVVHGGGPQINDMLGRVNLPGEFIQGMRVTDAETMEIVEMVLGGQVNKEIAGLINQAGGRAIGITGRDGHFLRATPLRLQDECGERTVDIGQVGEVSAVDTDFLDDLLDQGLTPVIAPIGVGEDGRPFNINADLVAGSVARALSAAKLVLMTNIAGVLDKTGRLIPSLTPQDIAALMADGTISGGMIPKLQGALDAAAQGVRAVHITDGRVPHAVLLALLTRQPIGTAIVAA
jgi:acetylglutamate kinase